MTEKEALAAAEDYGRDVEHVQVLQEKYEHFMDELRNQQRNLEVVVDFSKQLRDGGHPNAAVISDRTAELNQQWSDLKELAQARHEALEGAKQVHTFDHDTDELVSWIHEKEAMLITEDYGQDLDAVEALERRHLAFEQDLHAVGEQVDSVKQTAARLGGEFPDAAEHIRSKQEEAGDAWSALLAQTEQKKSKLVESENLQSYFSDFRELMAWINEMMAIITSDELARDVPGAEALIEKHKEHRAAIDMKMGAFEKFTRSGEDLIARGHFLSDDIRDKIQKLDGARDQLLDTWRQRSVLYDQNLDAQMFKRDAEALQSWLRAREPVLRDANYGQSVKEVDELIQRHEDFEKTVESQRDRFQALNRETLVGTLTYYFVNRLAHPCSEVRGSRLVQ
ncbi:PREDICTED: spectrin alpha chain-like [Priapulus caudatus]|uniref:Spectrin alpha chain-like n=1 Tax=Priapulus caudatus TaxID=37621 RepID=A0ABM1EK03_PRICU|nr:PREDICTED: spectrin alpha chain-like [Priapulus caudatus]